MGTSKGRFKVGRILLLAFPLLALALATAVETKVIDLPSVLSALTLGEGTKSTAQVEVVTVRDMMDGTWGVVGKDAHGVMTSYVFGANVSTRPQVGDMVNLSTIKTRTYAWWPLDKAERKQYHQTEKDDRWRDKHRSEIALRSRIEIAVQFAVPVFILLLAGFLQICFR